MKKLLILLLCLLPVFAAAEGLPVLESQSPLQFAYDPTQLEDVVLLPGGIPLLHYTNQQGSTARDCLAAIAPNGEKLWQLILDPRPINSSERTLLAVEQTTVALQRYDPTNSACSTAIVGFDGQLLGSTTESPSEQPTCYNLENFQVMRWFGDYTEVQVPTVITHLPSGQRTETTLPGQGSFHAVGDQLMYFTWDEPGGRYWLFDSHGQTLIANETAPFGCERPVIGYSAKDDQFLYLFVWMNSPGRNNRSYSIFPVDAQGAILPALTSFNLGCIESEDFLTDYAKALSQSVAMGDGFMLLAQHPWVWGQPTTTDLYYLDCAGTLTLLDTFVQEDDVFLLPGTDSAHCCLLCRDTTGSHLLLKTYSISP